MKITINGILNETEYILGIWSARLRICRAIMNNFSDKVIQDVIDFKGKRDTSNYGDDGYAEMVDKVWRISSNYEDFNSAYWSHENLKFTSAFIMKLAKRRKEDIVNAKKKKVIEMKEQITELEEEIKKEKQHETKTKLTPR